MHPKPSRTENTMTLETVLYYSHNDVQSVAVGCRIGQQKPKCFKALTIVFSSRCVFSQRYDLLSVISLTWKGPLGDVVCATDMHLIILCSKHMNVN